MKYSGCDADFVELLPKYLMSGQRNKIHVCGRVVDVRVKLSPGVREQDQRWPELRMSSACLGLLESCWAVESG